MKEFTIWQHQQTAIKLACENENFAFLMEPGTGKTLSTIQVLRNIYAKHQRICSTLIVAPCIVLENWKQEILKFSRIKEESILVLQGPTKKRITLLQEKINSGQEFIAITNYEAIASAEPFYNALFNWAPSIVVLDESHKIKSPQSKRTKKLIAICDRAYHRYLLTGTPILNSPMDIFSQFRALDCGRTFGKSFFTFRARYFYDANANMNRQNYFPNWKIKKEATEEISRCIDSISFRAKKEDCIELPDFVSLKYHVNLSAKQRKIYEEMKNNFLVQLSESEFCSADITLTKILRMLQVISGFLPTDDGNVVEITDNPKLTALEELIEEWTPTSKIIIWCTFKQDYRLISNLCDKMGVKYVMVTGEQTAKEKFNNVENFNVSNDTRILIGNAAAAGLGINIFSPCAIYFSRTWNLGDDIQSQARNFRAGSIQHYKKATRIDLIAKDTIDEQIIQILERKLTSSDEILKHVKTALRGISEYNN